MGFIGLTFADLTVNFGGLRQGLLRILITAAAIIFFIVTAVTQVCCGCFPPCCSYSRLAIRMAMA